VSATSSKVWRQPDFIKLWAGQAISLLGSQVTLLALPLTAVLALHASAVQMGLLLAVGSAPALLIGLFVGVLVDRVRRRPLLIGANLGRAALLSLIPLAALLRALRLEYLYLVAFLVGGLTVVFDVAYTSYLPILVDETQLVEGNSALESTSSLAGLAGPGLADLLVQALSAPLAIGVAALSFLLSALSLGLIGRRERVLPSPANRASIWGDMGEGLRVVIETPTLRVLVGASAIFNLFDSALMGVYVLFITRGLGLPPAVVGVVFTVGGVGGLCGALGAGWVANHLGLGRTLVGSVLLAAVAELCIALAHGPFVVAAAEAAVECGALVYGVNNVSLRQALVSYRLQGRVNGTARFLSKGVIPIGAIVGGIVGDRYGLRAAVLIAGLGTLLAFAWIVLSPVRSLRGAPAPIEQSTRA